MSLCVLLTIFTCAQSSRYIAGCFYTDTSGIFEADFNHNSSAGGTNGVDKTVTSTLQATVNSERRSQWLILVRPQGVMEVRSMLLNLPTLLIRIRSGACPN
jgi:hypothetical protein